MAALIHCPQIYMLVVAAFPHILACPIFPFIQPPRNITANWYLTSLHLFSLFYWLIYLIFCQAFSLGLGDQFEAIKKAYREANLLLGDLIKVRCVKAFLLLLKLTFIINGHCCYWNSHLDRQHLRCMLILLFSEISLSEAIYPFVSERILFKE